MSEDMTQPNSPQPAQGAAGAPQEEDPMQVIKTLIGELGEFQETYKTSCKTLQDASEKNAEAKAALDGKVKELIKAADGMEPEDGEYLLRKLKKELGIKKLPSMNPPKQKTEKPEGAKDKKPSGKGKDSAPAPAA